MAENVQTAHRRYLVRQCVACGYDGALLQGGRAPRCARCGCDLHQRPARSYAEMEGLIGQPMSLTRRPGILVREQSKLIERWLLFLFIALMMIFAIVALASAAIHAP